MVPLYMALLIGFIFVLFAIILYLCCYSKMILSDITSGWTVQYSIAILGGVNILSLAHRNLHIKNL